MGRLIDEDALILRLRNESVIPFSKMLLNDEHRWFLKLEDMIKTQPTAYDIEKVVAELEYEAKLQKLFEEEFYARHNIPQANIHRYAEQCYRNKAVGIVRKGGATWHTLSS